ncbi:helix-turn-helix domain-containing protein [Aneurinibacillus sp. REN35]|uniref:helix-turn-helix domain-containing protein n=1 Tax=Aneurinibacillus sp. REN35 TaxID=3237286 RepID=UPI0035271775
MQIGDKLRSLRKSKGLTTSELADMVSVSQSYISRFENNRAVPDVDMLARILEALGTNIASFFANDDSLPPELDKLLKTAKKLTPSQIKAVQHLLDEMVHPKN